MLYRLPSSLLIKDWHQDASAGGRLAGIAVSGRETRIAHVVSGHYPSGAGYRLPSTKRKGYLDSVSYPFGSQPVLGDGFELTLPSALVESGGTLTISAVAEPAYRKFRTLVFPLYQPSSG